MKWPNGKRIAIMMAFDLDGETLWEENRNDADTMMIGRGSYGPIQGIPRILDLMDKHDARATFFVPGVTAVRYPEVVKEMIRCGHEIGYHGYTHDSWPTREQEDHDMTKTEKLFFDLTGHKIVGQRAPSGTMYDYSLELFLEHGYIYSSNFRNHDGPYIHEINGKKVPIVELPKDSIFDDTAYDMYANRPYQTPTWLKSGRDFCKVWKDEFDALAEEERMINFVIHPQFIGHISRINALDELMGYMKENGAWFETNENVARYVLKENGFEI